MDKNTALVIIAAMGLLTIVVLTLIGLKDESPDKKDK